jgi:hypothetical protein
MKKMNTQFLTPTKLINITNELSDTHKKSIKEETMEEIVRNAWRSYKT